MDRYDLYSNAHKGIRSQLFEAAALVACTDLASPDLTNTEECTRVRASLERLLGFLEEHAAHEDAILHPELARLAPELATELAGAHARLEGLQGEVARLAGRLTGAAPEERRALGRRLHEKLNQLVAEHLVHMAREECEANRMLWAHRTDAELIALHRRLVASVPPPRQAEWFAIMLPAMNPSERAALVGGMRAGLSEALFDACTAGARAALGHAAWQQVLAAIDAAAPVASNGSAR